MCIPTLLSCPILYVQVGHHRDIWYEVELNSVIDSVTFSLLSQVSKIAVRNVEREWRRNDCGGARILAERAHPRDRGADVP